MTWCRESKTNCEATTDHKCVSPYAVIIVKALDSENSAEQQRAKVTKALKQNSETLKTKNNID